jgi:hypothetical protein
MESKLFKKAERSQTKLRMAITGPAGSGKTMGALLIARGLVGPKGKIAVVDTENNSASYYSEQVAFDTAAMNPPYTTDKYIMAINAAVEAGYDCVVVDSLTHAWAGEGGILQQKEMMDARGGNSFTNWGKLTPQQNRLVSAVLHSPINIICTMRSKTEYTLVENDKGKSVPKKMGLAPIQREGFDYEFDVVLDIDLATHTAIASKDRTGVFSDKTFKIKPIVGEAISKWQASGAAVVEPKKENPKIDAAEYDQHRGAQETLV